MTSTTLHCHCEPHQQSRVFALTYVARNPHILSLHLNRCVARVCCKSVCRWLTAAPYELHTVADGRGVVQLLCFGRIQAITADTVIAYITHDDRPNIGPMR